MMAAHLPIHTSGCLATMVPMLRNHVHVGGSMLNENVKMATGACLRHVKVAMQVFGIKI